MEIGEAIEERLEVRKYREEEVPDGVKRRVLDAGRLAPSGSNTQHWRFVLLDDGKDLRRLAELSTSGEWVRGADFAVVILTDPERGFHEIDAGRAITHMQFAAFDDGVASCIFVGMDREGVKEYLAAPNRYAVPAVLGCGYPAGEMRGRKDRVPLENVAFRGRFGESLSTE